MDWYDQKEQVKRMRVQTLANKLLNKEIDPKDLIPEAPVELDREYDSVNRPKHYNVDPSGVECITITRHRNFNIGNAIKYLWRQGIKESSPQIEDLKKAVWYINDEINRLEKIILK